jgi:hypothetical protein
MIQENTGVAPESVKMRRFNYPVAINSYFRTEVIHKNEKYIGTIAVLRVYDAQGYTKTQNEANEPVHGKTKVKLIRATFQFTSQQI